MNKRLFRNISVMLGCLALLFMVGCGSQSTDTSATTSDSQTPENSADSGNESQASASGDAAYDVEKVKSTYLQTCAGCHGQNLEGGVGPALKGTSLSAEEILKVIENGRNTMPGGLVSGEDAKNLAAWIADQK